jgi:hypothetical protein
MMNCPPVLLIVFNRPDTTLKVFEREAIARAGQERTLREHTWYHRMQELIDIVERYL